MPNTALDNSPFRHRKLQLPCTICIDSHAIAMQHAAIENPHRQRVLNQPLDRPLQRPSPIRTVIPGFEDRFARRIRQLQRDTPVDQQLLQVLQPQIDDMRQLRLGSGWNTTMSSTRFKNSGRNCLRSSPITRSFASAKPSSPSAHAVAN